jgi:hypothetical protein
VETIESSLEAITPELQQIMELAREREWRVRYPKPQTTMAGWISSIHERYPIIKEWIRRIKEEIPATWISIVYVLYYAYTSPGSERHLEAHLETLIVNDEKILPKVKEMANKVLRAFVAAPRIVAGETRPGYEQPLLRAEMAKPPYEGRITQSQNLWQWGLQLGAEINYNVGDRGRIEQAEEKRVQVKKTVPMRLEVFDYDFITIRSYLEVNVPALWWTLPIEKLLELLHIEQER